MLYSLIKQANYLPPTINTNDDYRNLYEKHDKLQFYKFKYLQNCMKHKFRLKADDPQEMMNEKRTASSS